MLGYRVMARRLTMEWTRFGVRDTHGAIMRPVVWQEGTRKKPCMQRRLAPVLVAVFLAGCGQPAHQASPLQRLDRLTGSLRSTTREAARVSQDWSRLAARVSSADVPAARQEARTLQVNGRRLSRDASGAESSIRRISIPGNRRVVLQYVRDLTLALSAQSWEGREVSWTARLLALDPLLQDGQDAARLEYLSALARRSARQAVRLTQAALALRRGNRARFRYVPVSSGQS